MTTKKTTTPKEQTLSPEDEFQAALQREIDFHGTDKDYLIFKKLEIRGKQDRHSKPVPKPLVLKLENAGTTAEYLNRLIRKGWVLVHSNLTAPKERFDARGRPIKDERVEQVRAQVVAFETQLAGLKAMEAAQAGTKAKYQERVANG
jgi:hypothetical protein